MIILSQWFFELFKTMKNVEVVIALNKRVLNKDEQVVLCVGCVTQKRTI